MNRLKPLAHAQVGSALAGMLVAACSYISPETIPWGDTCSPRLKDATDELQAWIDSLPAADVTAELRPGCYRVEGTLTIGNRINFVLDGKGATLRSFNDPASRAGAHVSLFGNTNVTVKNLTIDGGATPGYDADLEFQHGFDLDGWPEGWNNGVTLTNVAANRVLGDFVYIRRSNDVEISDATFGNDGDPTTPDGNGRQGIAVVSGSNIRVHDSEISNAARAIIDLEPNDTTEDITNVQVDNNTIRHTTTAFEGLAFVANQGANSRIEHIDISNNTLIGRRFWVLVVQPNEVLDDLTDPSLYRRVDYRFNLNTSDTPAGSGSGAAIAVHIDGVRDAMVWGNSIEIGVPESPTFTSALVDFDRSHNLSLVGNTVTSDQDGVNDFLADYSADEVGLYLLEPWNECSVSGCVLHPAGEDITAEEYAAIPEYERPQVASVPLASQPMCEAGNKVGNPPEDWQTAGVPLCSW